MMLKYEKYKDSGIVWLGDIPEHWGASRLKDYSTKIQTGTTPKTSVLRYWENEDYNWFTPSDFTSSLSLVDSDRKINAIAIQENAARLFYKDSVFIIGIASVGKVGILAADSSANQQINSITFDRRVIPLFGAYFLKIYEDEIVKFANYSIVPIFNQTETGCLKFAVPPIPEQTAIVNYLDQKTAKLDKLIKNKEDQIVRLNQIRQIEINTAVTKGLDPNVTMKNSGIDWLGEIPVHWEIKRLKNIATVILGKMLQNNDSGSDTVMPYLRSKNVQWEKVDINDVKEMWFSDYEMERYRLKKNDIVVSEGGEIGRAALWANELQQCFIQNSVHKVTCFASMEPYCLLYQFVAAGYIGHFDKIVNRVSIAHLTKEKLVDVYFAKPPIEEQNEISNYLKTFTDKIDSLIHNIEKQIDQLDEIRKIEIYNAVTGKIKVV